MQDQSSLKFLDYRNKNFWFSLFLAGIFILSFFLRLHLLEYPIGNTDPYRDYLVSSHISNYGEFTLTGHPNSVFWGLGNSPVYYYLLAGFLIIKDSFLFLLILNIILQLLSAFFLYLISFRIFGKFVAILSTVLFLFSAEAFLQSAIFWQPYLMQVFVLGSFLLLLRAHQEQKPGFLWFSVGLFLVGSSIHQSAFSLLPGFFALVFFLAWRLKKNYFFIKTFFLSIFLGIIAFFPMASQLLINRARLGYVVPSQTFSGSVIDYLNNFAGNSIVLFNTIFPPWSGNITFNLILLFLTVILAGIYFFISAREKTKYVLLILIFSSQVLVFSSLIDRTAQGYYFTAVFGLLLVVIAEIAYRVFSPGIYKGIILAVFIALFMYAIHPDLLPKIKAQSNFLSTKTEVISAGIAIKKEVDIQALERNGDKTFFDIITYRNFGQGWFSVSSAPLWMTVEKSFGEKFVVVEYASLSDYKVTNTDEVVFLACLYDTHVIHDNQSCINNFLFEQSSIHRKQYSFDRLIHDGSRYVVYFFRKIE